MADRDPSVPAAAPGAETRGRVVPEDWPATATRALVDAISSVRAKTLGPAIPIARGVVYGIVVAVVALVLAVVFFVGLARLIDNYLPADMWATHLILGGAFTLAGLALWSRRPRGAAS